MFRAVVLFCAVLALAKGETTPVNTCWGSNSGLLPINAYIEGCSAQPCLLPQEQDAVIEVVFRAPYNMHRMTTVAVPYLGLASLPYDLGEKAATCNFLSNTYCPIVRDEVILYTLRMPIDSAFMPAGIQLPIEFRINDDNNRSIMCIRVSVRIVPPVAPSVGKLGERKETITVEV